MSSRRKGTTGWKSVRVPFGTIRSSFYQLRKRFFQSPRPLGPYLVVDEPLPTIEVALDAADIDYHVTVLEDASRDQREVPVAGEATVSG